MCGEAIGKDATGFGDAAEECAFGDGGGGEPGLECGDRAGFASAGDGDCRGLGLGFAAADGDAESVPGFEEVGEVVRRVTGKSLGTVFREEIAKPLGADFWIGLPPSEDKRVAELIPPPPGTALDANLEAMTEIQRNWIVKLPSRPM